MTEAIDDAFVSQAEAVQKALTALEAAQSKLAVTLQNDTDLQIHYLAIIPYRRAGEEDVVQPLEPQTLTDQTDARRQLIEALLSIRYEADQSAKATTRAPGLVAASQESLDQIAEVNRLRAALKDRVKQIPSWRRRVLNSIMRGVSKLQAYRQIEVLPRAPDHAHFFWAMNKTGGTDHTVDALKDRLEKELRETEEDNLSIRQALEYDLEKLNQLPGNEVVVQRRAIRPHPQCNLWLRHSPEDAYLPLFYLAGSGVDGQRPLSIVELPPIDPREASRRGLRADCQVESLPFLERIEVYRKQDRYRTFAGRAEPSSPKTSCHS